MLKCTSFATLWAELSFDHARRVTRVTSLKILGVKKVTNRLSISEHVRDVTSRCGQSMHALRILRCHGLPAESLQTECKAVVVAKLTYASPAWWGFTIADDIDIRIDGLLRRGAWAGLCGPTVPQLIDDADNKLFNCVLYNEQHVLHPLLRERHRTVYSLSRDNRPLLPHWWMMDGKQWCFSCEFQLSATDDIYPDISVVLAVVDCRSVYCFVQRRDVHPQITTIV